MKRILLVLTVALVMAAMVVATAAPSFAAKCRGETINPNFTCVHGGGPPHVENPGGHAPPGQQPSPGHSR